MKYYICHCPNAAEELIIDCSAFQMHHKPVCFFSVSQYAEGTPPLWPTPEAKPTCGLALQPDPVAPAPPPRVSWKICPSAVHLSPLLPQLLPSSWLTPAGTPPQKHFGNPVLINHVNEKHLKSFMLHFSVVSLTWFPLVEVKDCRISIVQN